MEAPVPAFLASVRNKQVLASLQGMGAHGDLVEILMRSVDPLGDVQLFSPDSSEYRYVVASTRGLIFGFAAGTSMIAFRLDARMKARALQTGGVECPNAGPEWVAVCHHLPDADWPAVDVQFWARKAYVIAREQA